MLRISKPIKTESGGNVSGIVMGASDSTKIIPAPKVVRKTNSNEPPKKKHYTQISNANDLSKPLLECDQCKYSTRDQWMLNRHVGRNLFIDISNSPLVLIVQIQLQRT